ncbi:hypothetical protein OHA57_04610 [Streptomyces anulatus]|uniref:hypothetical protein n=1 Tax=Streptomyces anulatus TaxID=1892 RepID=UPI002DD9CF0E|nr:hypothetical protein [Streptomyces anulatus]WSC60060.1 hypothetical protein OHA57_04610 [Streptomyces anulatus]
MTPRVFCGSCARRLAAKRSYKCPLGCGTRVCGAWCLDQHAPYNCPSYQTHTGIKEAS